jgi:hypothetical protein
MPNVCKRVAGIRDVTPSALGGEECLKMGSPWVHLRLCRTCGHVGCCDDSPNRHATKHFHRTGHPIIEGCDPPEGWGWCYVDEVMIDLGERTGRSRALSELRQHTWEEDGPAYSAQTILQRSIDLQTDHVRGGNTAQRVITLVVYGNYLCFYGRRSVRAQNTGHRDNWRGTADPEVAVLQKPYSEADLIKVLATVRCKYGQGSSLHS